MEDDPQWEMVAVTGDRFADFAPFVPAIDDAGVVAFQARLTDGRTGVFTSDRSIERFDDVISHPDRDDDGAAWFYTPFGLMRAGRDRADGLYVPRVGPLGPTAAGRRVAFRADDRLYLVDQRIVEVAVGFRGFEGLPVVVGDGAVVFRCDTGIHVARGGSVEAVALVGSEFADLGRFPSASRAGRIAFVATLAAGGSAVVVDGEVSLDEGAGFSSFRGVLVGDDGPVVVLATPVDGTLGVYAGGRRLSGLGDALLGSTVTDLALNPVSRADVGWLALRVALGDGRQAILRIDTRRIQNLPDREHHGTILE